jgi:hypothetical protein
VRHIEHTGGAAHRVMLTDLGAVLHRHVPAPEIDHAGAELLVKSEQWGLSRHGGVSQPIKEAAGCHARTQVNACRPSVL